MRIQQLRQHRLDPKIGSLQDIFMPHPSFNIFKKASQMIAILSNGPQKLDSSISALPGYAANLAAG